MKKNLCTYIPLNWFYYQKITKLKSGFTECRLVSRSATTEDTNSFEPLFVLICCRCTVFFSFHSSPKKGSGKKGGKGGICKRCMKDCVLREASRRSRSRSRHLCFWFSPHPFIQTLLFVCLNKYLVLVNSPTRAHLHLSFYPPLPSLPPSLPLSLSLSLSLQEANKYFMTVLLNFWENPYLSSFLLCPSHHCLRFSHFIVRLFILDGLLDQ